MFDTCTYYTGWYITTFPEVHDARNYVQLTTRIQRHILRYNILSTCTTICMYSYAAFHNL